MSILESLSKIRKAGPERFAELVIAAAKTDSLTDDERREILSLVAENNTTPQGLVTLIAEVRRLFEYIDEGKKAPYERWRFHLAQKALREADDITHRQQNAIANSVRQPHIPDFDGSPAQAAQIDWDDYRNSVERYKAAQQKSREYKEKRDEETKELFAEYRSARDNQRAAPAVSLALELWGNIGVNFPFVAKAIDMAEMKTIRAKMDYPPEPPEGFDAEAEAATLTPTEIERNWIAPPVTAE